MLTLHLLSCYFNQRFQKITCLPTILIQSRNAAQRPNGDFNDPPIRKCRATPIFTNISVIPCIHLNPDTLKLGSFRLDFLLFYLDIEQQLFGTLLPPSGREVDLHAQASPEKQSFLVPIGPFSLTRFIKLFLKRQNSNITREYLQVYWVWVVDTRQKLWLTLI